MATQNGQPAEQEAPAGQPEPEPAPIDPDAIRLAAFEQELAAEQQGAVAPPGAPSVADQALVPGQEPAVTQGEQRQPPNVTIPLPRLNHEIKRRREAEIDAAQQRGKAEALQALIDAGLVRSTPGAGSPPAPGTGQQPTYTLQEREDAAMLQQREIFAKQYAGEMSPEEWSAKDQLLVRELFEIRQAMVDEARRSAPSSDLTLEERTRQIEENFPIISDLSEAQLMPLAELARQQMQIEGTPYDRASASSVLRLRELTAMAANRLYSDGPLPGNGQPGPGTPSGNATSAPTRAAPPGNQPTAADRRGKLALAGQQPPSLASMPGTAEQGMDGLTEAAIMAMSHEQLMLLPTSILDRLEQQGIK